MDTVLTLNQFLTDQDRQKDGLHIYSLLPRGLERVYYLFPLLASISRLHFLTQWRALFLSLYPFLSGSVSWIPSFVYIPALTPLIKRVKSALFLSTFLTIPKSAKMKKRHFLVLKEMYNLAITVT